jgi:hypothetical protein
MVKNNGTADITVPFWVDLYVDPQGVPQPNRLWPDLSDYGLAWRIHSLGADDEVTLSSSLCWPIRMQKVSPQARWRRATRATTCLSPYLSM